MSPLRSAGSVAGLAVLLLIAACATAAPGGFDADAPRGKVITAEAIAKTGASTVWDALRLTVRFATFTTDSDGRPGSIRTRGQSSISHDDRMLVYVDRVLLADIRLLGNMDASAVERIEVLSGIEATTYFGTNAGDGVIHIVTKHR